MCDLCNGDHADALAIELHDVPLLDAGNTSNVVLILRIIEHRFCSTYREFYEKVTDEYNEGISIIETLYQ